MLSDKEAMSEQSLSVREGEGYDEVYPSRYDPKEDVSWSPEREPSAHSPSEEEEEWYEENEGEEKGDEDEEGEEMGEEENDEEGDGGEVAEEMVRWADGNGPRPFILPLIWTVNDFYPTMSSNVFNKIRNHFQILDNIPICLSRNFEKCYSGKTTDVGMYDAMFVAVWGCCWRSYTVIWPIILGYPSTR